MKEFLVQECPVCKFYAKKEYSELDEKLGLFKSLFIAALYKHDKTRFSICPNCGVIMSTKETLKIQKENFPVT